MSYLCRRPAMRKKERGREERRERRSVQQDRVLLGCVDAIPFPAGVITSVLHSL